MQAQERLTSRFAGRILSAVMKTPYAIGLAAAAVLVTLAVEETRIASLRTSPQPTPSPTVGPVVAAPRQMAPAQGSAPDAATPHRSQDRPALKPNKPAGPLDTDDGSLAKTVRKMWENPAGKSMMNQGVKMAVAMMYQDLVGSLGLSKEEADYFNILLGKEMSKQQELGMKMLGASEEERKALTGELATAAKDSEEEIKQFLNSDEDFKSYTDYKNRLPEHQQLDGIRSALAGKGVPLEPATEDRLLDTMYRARTTASAPDLSGPGALDAMAKGDLVGVYEKSWEQQQQAIRAEAGGFLSEPQMAAFQEYQKQVKEMQLMSIKMAEKMMSGKKEGGE